MQVVANDIDLGNEEGQWTSVCKVFIGTLFGARDTCYHNQGLTHN